MKIIKYFILFVFALASCKDDSVNPIENNEYSYVFFYKTGTSPENPGGIFRLALDGSGEEILISSFADLLSKPGNGKICYQKMNVDQWGAYISDIDASNEELVIQKAKAPVLSPDGKLIAYANFKNANEIQVELFNIETKESSLIDKNCNWLTYSLFSDDSKYLYYYSYLGDDMNQNMCLKVYDIENQESKVLVENVRYTLDQYETVILQDKKSGDLLFCGYNDHHKHYGIVRKNGDIISCIEESAYMYSIYDSKVYYGLIENADLPENYINKSMIKDYNTGNEELINECEYGSETDKDSYIYIKPINEGKDLLLVRQIIEYKNNEKTITWRWEKMDLETKSVTILKDYGHNNVKNDGHFMYPGRTYLY